ncbi:hypothetical protein Fmac_014365 [Flemingia macrophylla]|uniref:Uncharacterized protein n=1 Tax=Flemingia macrophylla TaxID=520843 RepID=A0ABD1MC02_9FABA
MASSSSSSSMLLLELKFLAPQMQIPSKRRRSLSAFCSRCSVSRNSNSARNVAPRAIREDGAVIERLNDVKWTGNGVANGYANAVRERERDLNQPLWAGVASPKTTATTGLRRPRRTATSQLHFATHNRLCKHNRLCVLPVDVLQPPTTSLSPLPDLTLSFPISRPLLRPCRRRPPIPESSEVPLCHDALHVVLPSSMEPPYLGAYQNPHSVVCTRLPSTLFV